MPSELHSEQVWMCLREPRDCGGGAKDRELPMPDGYLLAPKEQGNNEESSLENGLPDDVLEFGSELNFNSQQWL